MPVDTPLLKTSQSEAAKLFQRPEKNEKQYDFYKHFLSPTIVERVSLDVRSRYTTEEFDNDTGEAISGVPMSEADIIIKYKNSLSTYVENIDKVNIRFVLGIPVAYTEQNNLTSEYLDTGAFITGSELSPTGILVVSGRSQVDHELDLQHELVHIAVSKLGLGNLKIVEPEEKNGIILNDDNLQRFFLAKSFIDEALAYGTNLFEHNQLATPEMIQRYFFYNTNTEASGYNLIKNSETLSQIINQVNQDRSGKMQFRFSYFLTKHVRSLDDLDFENNLKKDQFIRITGIKF